MYTAPLLTNIRTDDQIDLLAGNISPDPLDIALNYTLQSYADEHFREQALLLNPYFDDAETYFVYEADDVTEEVKIITKKNEYSAYVKADEESYGINRIELKNLRYSVFKNFRAFKRALPEIADAVIRREVEEQINSMLSSKYNFAGMNRYFNAIL